MVINPFGCSPRQLGWRADGSSQCVGVYTRARRGRGGHCISSVGLNSETLPFILLIVDPLAPLNLKSIKSSSPRQAELWRARTHFPNLSRSRAEC